MKKLENEVISQKNLETTEIEEIGEGKFRDKLKEGHLGKLIDHSLNHYSMSKFRVKYFLGETSKYYKILRKYETENNKEEVRFAKSYLQLSQLNKRYVFPFHPFDLIRGCSRTVVKPLSFTDLYSKNKICFSMSFNENNDSESISLNLGLFEGKFGSIIKKFLNNKSTFHKAGNINVLEGNKKERQAILSFPSLEEDQEVSYIPREILRKIYRDILIEFGKNGLQEKGIVHYLFPERDAPEINEVSVRKYEGPVIC